MMLSDAEPNGCKNSAGAVDGGDGSDSNSGTGAGDGIASVGH